MDRRAADGLVLSMIEPGGAGCALSTAKNGCASSVRPIGCGHGSATKVTALRARFYSATRVPELPVVVLDNPFSDLSFTTPCRPCLDGREGAFSC